MRKVSYYTLGCKLNFAETSTVGRLLEGAGYVKVEFGEESDVTVINTCTVTSQADKKCRQMVGRALKFSPRGKVVLVGCFAETDAETLRAMEGVSLVLGNKDKFNIVERLGTLFGDDVGGEGIGCSDAYMDFAGSYSLHDRTRSFLKIQDGCDYRCAYCAIPMARGRSRSSDIEGVLRQAGEIARSGVKEIVLTGVNIGDFGRGRGENFYDLLVGLNTDGRLNGVERIRIGSVEPNLLTEEIVKLLSEGGRMVPHVHMPLQSGSNKILKLMGRRYVRELFAERVAMVRSYMPQAGIGSDVIVGFPGETEEDFMDTYNFIDGLGLSYMHVFPYSERRNTRAVLMDGKVSTADKEDRVRRLIALGEGHKARFYAKQVGIEVEVLLESKEQGGMVSGLTGNYVRVLVGGGLDSVGEVKKVRIIGVESGVCVGELVG